MLVPWASFWMTLIERLFRSGQWRMSRRHVGICTSSDNWRTCFTLHWCQAVKFYYKFASSVCNSWTFVVIDMQLLQACIHQENLVVHKSRLSLLGQWIWNGQHHKLTVDLVLLAMLWCMVLQLHPDLCILERLSKAQLLTAHWRTGCGQEELIRCLLQLRTELGVENFQISLWVSPFWNNRVRVFHMCSLYAV